MYIQEIILEGFKSYPTRTVISGWDAEFNAITGLNGSGKSNILDAIIFVLGLENLRQVRATTLQDLVYKRGQAGITKASVTIVFNNEEAAQSPVGYAEHRQITVTRQIIVGGKNKYLVNGHNATTKVVENLFQSVQLNINNPHFLIMQGQITKVLNMKPPEILAMIEETAGTRMFEDRKLKALLTMERKERKVEEIEALLQDMIEPKLDALRREKGEYVEYKRGEAEIERVARFLAAFDYHGHTAAKAGHEAELEAARVEMASAEQEVREAKLELERVDDKLLAARTKREMESKGLHRLKELEAQLKEAEHELVRLQTQAGLAQESLNQETAAAAALAEQIVADEATLRKREASAERERAASDEHELAYATLKAQVDKDAELLRSLSTGLSSSGAAGGASGYDQLASEAQDRIASAVSRIQQAELRLRSLDEAIAGMGDEVAQARKEGSGASSKIEGLKSELARLQAEEARAAAEFDAQQEGVLEAEARRADAALHPLREQLEQLRTTVASISFGYSDPSPNFDRSAVKGVVAELVHLPPESARYAQALEVAAGGKLYNVVVSEERVASELLEKGRLTRRVTIIPLDRIVAKPVPEAKARLGSQLTNGRATVGLSLVTCAEDVLAAIQYVFGSAFVCEDKEAAAMVAFDGRLGCKAVTVDGDVYEPAGTLSGGSASSGGSVLARLAEYQRARTQHDALQSEMDRNASALNEIRAARRRHADIAQRCEHKRHELSLATRRAGQDASGRIVQQYEALLADREAPIRTIAEAGQEKAAAENELARVRKEMGEFASDRSGKLRALETAVANGKKALAAAAKGHDAAGAKWAKTQAELAAAAQRFAGARDSAVAKKAQLERLADDVAGLRSAYLEQQTRTVGLRVRHDGELAHLRRFDDELRALSLHRQQLVDCAEQAQVDRARLLAHVASLGDAVSKAAKAAQALHALHPWIRDQERGFGLAGGPFDFDVDMAACRARLAALKEQHARLRRNINFNVMDMIDRIEAKETALRQMLATVRKDRRTIESTIARLNEYKLEALDKTFRKVNDDFGLILGDLLPGGAAFARLQPLDGAPVTDGLEIRVRLGGVWKASLVELSGGQRSVIALALILALLQFKPAPMYILDEVDAALDLSHTENIGRLFQTRFKGSQFIVVSLKEGMFSNANVLFRTRFRDGISSVERIQNVPDRASAKTKPPAVKRSGIALPKAKSQVAAAAFS